MKRFFKWTGFVLFAAIIGLALSVAFVAGARAQSPVAVVQRAITLATPSPIPSTPWGYGYWNSYGSAGIYTPTQSLSYYGYGPGMMSPSMMGGYGGWSMGTGMHRRMLGGYGGWGYGVALQGTPTPVDEDAFAQLTATDSRFDPATITVKAGEAVRLVIANQDSVPHNLYSPNVPIAYVLLPAGATQSVSFTAPTATRTYLAVCTFHPGMNLEIIVK